MTTNTNNPDLNDPALQAALAAAEDPPSPGNDDPNEALHPEQWQGGTPLGNVAGHRPVTQVWTQEFGLSPGHESIRAGYQLPHAPAQQQPLPPPVQQQQEPAVELGPTPGLGPATLTGEYRVTPQTAPTQPTIGDPGIPGATRLAGSTGTWCKLPSNLPEARYNKAAYQGLEMIRAVELAKKGANVLFQDLERGYNNVPPDPGFVLGRSNGKLFIGYLPKLCTQPGTTLQHNLVMCMGDIQAAIQIPALGLLNSTHPLLMNTDEMNLAAIATHVDLKNAAAQVPQRTTVQPSDFLPSRSGQGGKHRVVPLLKIPTSLLLKALTAHDPQADPLSFVYYIVKQVRGWRSHAARWQGLPPRTHALAELTIIENSLIAMVMDDKTKESAMDTGAPAMDCNFDIIPDAPDVQGRDWVVRNLKQLQFVGPPAPAITRKDAPPAVGTQELPPLPLILGAPIQAGPPAHGTTDQLPIAGGVPQMVPQPPQAGLPPGATYQQGLPPQAGMPPGATYQHHQPPQAGLTQPGATYQQQPQPPQAGLPPGATYQHHQPPQAGPLPQAPPYQGWAGPPGATYQHPQPPQAGPPPGATYMHPQPPQAGLPPGATHMHPQPPQAGHAQPPYAGFPPPPQTGGTPHYQPYQPPGYPPYPGLPQQHHVPPGHYQGAALASAVSANARQNFLALALPDLAAFMGFPILPHDESWMPPVLPQLYQHPEKLRSGLFARHAKKFITDNRDCCDGFTFPNISKTLSKLELGIPELDQWHLNLGPGVALIRNREQSQAHEKMHQQRADWADMNVNWSTADTKKLEAPIPQLPTNLDETYKFLERYTKILAWLLTEHCNLAQIVKTVLTEIKTAVEKMRYPATFFTQRVPHIIWSLVIQAMTFFERAPLHGHYAPAIISSNIRQTAYEIVHQTTHPIAELPASFSLLLYNPMPPPPLVAPPPQWNGGHQPANPQGGQPRGQQPAGGPRPRRQGQPVGTPSQLQTRVNPNAVPALVDLFRNLQMNTDVANRHKRTRAIIQEAQLDMPRAQVLLGLQPQDCFNFHARGSCNSPACQLLHNQAAITEAGANQLIAQLQPAADRIRAKRPRYI